MPLSLLNHSALALFAQRTRIPTSARSIGFCAIWVCISSSSSRNAVLSVIRILYLYALKALYWRLSRIINIFDVSLHKKNQVHELSRLEVWTSELSSSETLKVQTHAPVCPSIVDVVPRRLNRRLNWPRRGQQQNYSAHLQQLFINILRPALKCLWVRSKSIWKRHWKSGGTWEWRLGGKMIRWSDNFIVHISTKDSWH